MKTWGKHVYRSGNLENLDAQHSNESKNIEFQKKHIEPWLAAVFQSEHLALLLGSGSQRLLHSRPKRVPLTWLVTTTASPWMTS